MSDDPKQKPDPRVPSFDELKGPKRPAPAAAPPSHHLGEEEKTSTIDVGVLRKVLQQSQQGAPIPPPPKPPSLAIGANTRLPLAPLAGAPARPPPPPPGARPPGPTTDPETRPIPRPPEPPTDREMRPVPRNAPPPPPGSKPAEWSPTATTTPSLPQVRPQTAVPVMPAGRPAPPPPGGSRPTERMPPVTPEPLPGPQASTARPPAAVQAGAPRAPDPSLHQTQLSMQHQRARLPDAAPEPKPTSPTVLEERPRGAAPSPPRSLSMVTQPAAESPFVSRRHDEPPSNEKPAAAPSLPLEPPTRNERPSSRPGGVYDLEADINSEVEKLRTDPGSPGPALKAPSLSAEPTTGRVDLVEVLAHPAPPLRRLAAFAVDGLVLAVLDLILAALVMVLGKAPPLPEGLGLLDVLSVRVHDSGKLVAAALVLAVGLATTYTTLFAVVWSGRSIGRRLLGLHLVDARGAPPQPVHALVRALLALLSFALFGTGFWWGLFDRKGQTLHDKLCSTFVVRLGPSRT